MGKLSLTLLAVCGLVLTACASTPKIKVNYYLAETALKMKVVRTVGCNEGNYPIIATTVTPTVSHSADAKKAYPVELAKLNSNLANTDTKFEFYEDGRLKGVNATAVGQGEAILKSVLSLVSPSLFLSGEVPFPEKCETIRKHTGNKVVTLTYSGDVALAAGTTKELDPEEASKYYDDYLKVMIGNVCAQVIALSPPKAAPVLEGLDTKGVLLKARQPGTAAVRVTAGRTGPCGSDVVWGGIVPVAQAGTEYDLPIPRAEPFGRRVFAVSFAESGALTSVQYAADTGATGALGALNAAYAAADVTAAERAAELKAEADVIAQQQRLVVCLADQTACK